MWFVGVTCSACAEITRINEQQASGGLVHKVWIKETQTEVRLFMSLPFLSHWFPPGSNTESDWHCNHRRVFWHQIQLFVNAEHSQEFIFMQCISSVTYSEHWGSEHTLGRRAASKHPNNYTCRHMTSGWFSLQAAGSVDKKKKTLPRGKMHMTYFHLPFHLPMEPFLSIDIILFHYFVWLPEAFYLYYWAMWLWWSVLSAIVLSLYIMFGMPSWSQLISTKDRNPIHGFNSDCTVGSSGGIGCLHKELNRLIRDISGSWKCSMSQSRV